MQALFVLWSLLSGASVVRPADLPALSKELPAEIAKLFEAIAVPADQLVVKEQPLRIRPLARTPLSAKGRRIALTPLTGKAVETSSEDIREFTPYEESALGHIKPLLGKGTDADRLAAAEIALTAVLRFHYETRIPERTENPWQPLADRLERALYDVRCDRLQLLSGEEQAKYADKLHAIYPDDGGVLTLLRALWARQADAAVTRGDITAAQVLLERIDKHFVRAPEAAKARAALMKHSVEAGKDGRVLRVGVMALPEALSPPTAWTDADRVGAELLFESLVRPAAPQVSYEPQLAEALPSVRSLTRRFALRPDAAWANGERVTSIDVRHTAQFAMPPSWHDLIETPELEQASARVDFRLRQGLFDPLGLLSFKVLPQSYKGKPLQVDDPAFARQPIGSGPYEYVGRTADDGTPSALFRVNRHHRPAPAISEIRFVVWDEKSLPDVILDVPAARVDAVVKAGKHRLHALRPQRVHFLAVNHRVAVLADSNVRRALAHVIDREAILTDVYRGAGDSQAEQHRSLNGLYPPESWACCPPPRVPVSLFNEDLAKETLRKATDRLNGLELTLKHSNYDPRTAAACAAIAAQVNKLAEEVEVKFRLHCRGLSAAEMKQAVDDRDYDLAYMEHDFIGSSYWLGPWFDVRPQALAKGGSNFLGYQNDGKLLELLHAASAHRQFAIMQELTHALHARLHETMPFIPLWQLQRTVAVHRDLEAVRLDPTHVFAHLERWRFAAK